MPRDNTLKHETVERRPTGTIGSIAAALVALAAALGLDLSPELAAAIVGLVVAAASYLTPREG